MTKLVDQRTADEAVGPRDQGFHGRRVYWRAWVILAAALVLSGCDTGKRRTHPGPPPRQSFRALDAQQQRLVADYEPVSRAMTAYELAHRGWRAGRLASTDFDAQARSFRDVVTSSVRRVRRDPAIGATVRGKRLLVRALAARRGALDALLAGRLELYQTRWNRSLANARAGLTVLQDIRDRARLIPLPEDSVS